MTTVFLPGLGGSGVDHWQSRWQEADPSAIRFAPASWDAPRPDDWIDALDRALAIAGPNAVLVAHSLGAVLVAHWAARRDAGQARERVAGAFLVAPPDTDAPSIPPEVAGFARTPTVPLPFPALLVTSRDDPYGSPAFAARIAAAWRAEHIDAGALGHINVASGHGEWPRGEELLAAFRARLGG